jgi:hypothetical protein
MLLCQQRTGLWEREVEYSTQGWMLAWLVLSLFIDATSTALDASQEMYAWNWTAVPWNHWNKQLHSQFHVKILNCCVLEKLQRNVWSLTWLIPNNGEVSYVWIFKLRITERIPIKSIYGDRSVSSLVNLIFVRIDLVKWSSSRRILFSQSTTFLLWLLTFLKWRIKKCT